MLFQSDKLCHKTVHTAVKLGLHLLNHSKFSIQKLYSSLAVKKRHEI